MNLKSTNERIDNLTQVVNGLALQNELLKTEQQKTLLQIRNELRVELTEFFSKQVPQVPAKQEQQGTQRDSRDNCPWRIDLKEFAAFRDGCKANWDDNGNARVSQRLARSLKRSSGHTEGQLYINWCEKVGREAVAAYWKQQGFDNVPEGL